MSRRRLRKLTAFGNAGANGPGSGGGILNTLLTGEGEETPRLYGLEVEVLQPNTVVSLDFVLLNHEFSSYPIEEGMNLEWGDGSSENLSLTSSDIASTPLSDLGLLSFFSRENPTPTSDPNAPYDSSTLTLPTDPLDPNIVESFFWDNTPLDVSDGVNWKHTRLFRNTSSNPPQNAPSPEIYLGTAFHTSQSYNFGVYSSPSTGPAPSSVAPYSVGYESVQISYAEHQTKSADPKTSNLFSSKFFGGSSIIGGGTVERLVDQGYSLVSDYPGKFRVKFRVTHTYSSPGTYYIHPQGPDNRDANFERTWNRLVWGDVIQNLTTSSDYNWIRTYSTPKDPVIVAPGLYNIAIDKNEFFENYHPVRNQYYGYSPSSYNQIHNDAISSPININISTKTRSISAGVTLDKLTGYKVYTGDASNVLEFNGNDAYDFSGLTNLAPYYFKMTAGTNIPSTPLETEAEKVQRIKPTIEGMDMSNVQTLFRGLQRYNDYDINYNSWDVGNCENFEELFDGAGGSITSQPIRCGSWNIGQNVYFDRSKLIHGVGWRNREGQQNNQHPTMGITMYRMFRSARSPEDITGWDTSKVIMMTEMFQNNPTFNQDISSWDFTGLINGDRTTIANVCEPGVVPNYLTNQNPGFHNPLRGIFIGTAMSSQNVSNVLVKWESDAYAANTARGVDVAGGDTPIRMINYYMNTWTDVSEATLTTAAQNAITTLETVFGWQIGMNP